METNGELPVSSPAERIRAAAIGYLLDAEYGISMGIDQLQSRRASFFLDVVTPEENNDLKIVHIKTSEGSLYIGVTQFEEDLAATSPVDVYAPTGLTFIEFPDPFDATTIQGDRLTEEELEAVAAVLGHDYLEEFSFGEVHDTGDKTFALMAANMESNSLFTDRLLAHYAEAKNQNRSPESSKARRIAGVLRRILRF